MCLSRTIKRTLLFFNRFILICVSFRSISYRINNFYHHHVIVLAETKLPTLELSTNHIVLNQLNGVTPDNCYRANLTLRNPYDASTEFNWMPIYGEQGTTFSIRPASGIIEPFKDLECELVWHASYLAPLRGTFSLLVKGGESVKLTCEAKVGYFFSFNSTQQTTEKLLIISISIVFLSLVVHKYSL